MLDIRTVERKATADDLSSLRLVDFESASLCVVEESGTDFVVFRGARNRYVIAAHPETRDLFLLFDDALGTAWTPVWINLQYSLAVIRRDLKGLFLPHAQAEHLAAGTYLRDGIELVAIRRSAGETVFVSPASDGVKAVIREERESHRACELVKDHLGDYYLPVGWDEDGERLIQLRGLPSVRHFSPKAESEGSSAEPKVDLTARRVDAPVHKLAFGS